MKDGNGGKISALTFSASASVEKASPEFSPMNFGQGFSMKSGSDS